jgi:hypothetical protein
MKGALNRFAIIALVSLIASAFVNAATLRGTVKNATSGTMAAGVEVILIQLQGGMQPVANTKTDAQGRFTFENDTIGAQPMLVRAVYKGVNFHQPAPPGKNDIQVDIYEPTKDSKTISVASRIVFFQPSGANLTVGEEYTIENNSQPPQAYFRPDGNFEFAIPENGHLQQVAAAGPAGMPVVQLPMDKKKGRYAIAFAFRPGQSTVRYSYEVPYPGNAATVKVSMVYPAARLLVVAPPSVQVKGEGLQAGREEQGMSVYGRENVAANTVMPVSLSGTAPPLAADNSGGADSGGGGGAGRDAQESAATTGNIQQIPGRLDVLKWPLIVGFLGLFALAALLLSRKQVVAMPAGVPVDLAALPTAKTARAGTKAAQLGAKSDANPLASVDAAVGLSLDALKDQLFRLELRRQAGTISEEEYARERARAEKVLRDLVRG